jgi:hypothetical protein
MLNALEGMMVQIVVIVTKNNNPHVASKAIIQEETPQEQLALAIVKTRSQNLGKTFEYNVFPTMDPIKHVITNFWFFLHLLTSWGVLIFLLYINCTI